jgi:hypothetical protein
VIICFKKLCFVSLSSVLSLSFRLSVRLWLCVPFSILGNRTLVNLTWKLFLDLNNT